MRRRDTPTATVTSTSRHRLCANKTSSFYRHNVLAYSGVWKTVFSRKSSPTYVQDTYFAKQGEGGWIYPFTCNGEVDSVAGNIHFILPHLIPTRTRHASVVARFTSRYPSLPPDPAILRHRNLGERRRYLLDHILVSRMSCHDIPPFPGLLEHIFSISFVRF